MKCVEQLKRCAKICKKDSITRCVRCMFLCLCLLYTHAHATQLTQIHTAPLTHIRTTPLGNGDVLHNPPRIYNSTRIYHATPSHYAKRASSMLDSTRDSAPHTRLLESTTRDSSAHDVFDSSAYTYYKPNDRKTYLNTTIGLLGGGIVASIIGLYLMPESVTNWDRSRFGFQAWLQDVRIGPVIDSDNFILNGIAHPYFGAVYYMQPRVAGYSWAESALFAFLTSSVFWEYGIEAFVEIPSWQDLIYTPAFGSIFGEAFYQATKYIQSNDNRLLGSRVLGLIAVGLMDPLGVIMRDFGLAKAMGVRDMRQVVSYATPLRLSLALRF